MRKACLWVFWLVGIAICAGMVFGGLGYSVRARFLNPDLSETRLFMQCWWAYALVIIGCFWGSAFLSVKPWGKH